MVSSEISTSFTVNAVESVAGNYVPTETLWSDYGGIVIGILIAVGIIYFVLRKRKKTHKRKIKKISKRKKKK